MQPLRARAPGDWIVSAIFVAMLLVPEALALAGYAAPDAAFILNHEQRRPFVAPPPSSGALATAGYERDLEREIADRFPLRTPLIEGYDVAKFVLLNASTSPNVIRGRDGWLFYGAEERQYVTGAWSPGDATLAHIASVYVARARWCTAHGIRYVLVFAPNKSTVYASEAPAWYRPQAPTPLDRLLPRLRAARVAAIDVRTPLANAARSGEVYSPGDTHWNDAGAYVAYRAVVATLRTAGVRDALVPSGTHVESRPGDLLNFSGVGARILDRVVRLDYARRARAATVSPQLTAAAAAALFTVDVSTVDDPALPSAVVFGDSFSDQLAPLLAEDFRRTVHLQAGTALTPQFDERILLAERPTVVVQELVERNVFFGDAFRP